MDDAIGVVTSICGTPRGTARTEHAQRFVILRHLARPEHMDLNRGLGCWRPGAGFFRRDGGIAADDLGDMRVRSIPGTGRYIQQQQAFDLTAQHAALDGRADGAHSSGLMPLIFASKALNSLLYSRDSGGTADQRILFSSDTFNPESDKA